MVVLSRAQWRVCGVFLGAVALLVAGAVPAAGLPGSGQSGPGQQVRSAELPALEAIGAPAAWPASRGAGVTVAVLDTGADGAVPDLTGSVHDGPDLIAGIDPPGYQPSHLHGTYIASLIAGHGSGPGKADGVIGVAPAARLLSIRVIPDDNEPGIGIFSANPTFGGVVGDGIRYAVDHGARAINLSLGGPESVRDLRVAIGYAISRDVVVIASAGNSGTAHGGFTPYDYPASYPGVISVAAVNAAGSRAAFSDRNASVVISAPGVAVVGAAPGGGYLQGDGTSPAAALVTGVVALILSRYPSLSPALVEHALVTTTTHRPSGGYSPAVGFGEVDAPAALASASRLARAQADRGLRSSARFAAQSLGPIQVAHRNGAKIAGYAGAAAAAALGFVVALALAVVASVRAARNRARRRPIEALTALSAQTPDPGYPEENFGSHP